MGPDPPAFKEKDGGQEAAQGAGGCRPSDFQHLWRMDVFRRLTVNQRRALAPTFSRRQLPAGAILVRSGQVLDDAYYVLRGRMKAVLEDARGREHICNWVNAYEYFANHLPYHLVPVVYTLVVTEPVTCLVQGREALLAMFAAHPHMKDFFYHRTIERLLGGYHMLSAATSDHVRIAADTGHVPPPVRAALDYITLHLKAPITLKSTADAVGIDRARLSHLFRRHTGGTFREFLVRQRIETAKELMRRRDVNVSEAAYRTGFNAPSHFSRVFRRIEGISPSVFRKRHGKGM